MISSSETSVHIGTTRRFISEDDNIRSSTTLPLAKRSFARHTISLNISTILYSSFNGSASKSWYKALIFKLVLERMWKETAVI
jgi:hypothetical protein